MDLNALPMGVGTRGIKRLTNSQPSREALAKSAGGVGLVARSSRQPRVCTPADKIIITGFGCGYCRCVIDYTTSQHGGPRPSENLSEVAKLV